MEFDDEVLGAPAYSGLLYLASTQNGRLSEVIQFLLNKEIREWCDVLHVMNGNVDRPPPPSRQNRGQCSVIVFFPLKTTQALKHFLFKLYCT